MMLSKRIGLSTATLLILTIGLAEASHLVRFGHLFPFSLHADVLVRKEDYGIKGITKVYKAQLTNYGIMPTRLTACDFVDDTLSRRTMISYTVEKWDLASGSWKSMFKSDKSAFCHPYPPGMGEGHVISKQLWPGQSVSTTEEATAARDIFEVDDKARFIVFARSDLAFRTAAFSIDEHPVRQAVP